MLLFASLVLASCATSAERFQSKLGEMAGRNARSCGLAALNQPPEESASCARSALSTHTPFMVGFQLQGIDSQIWEGLTMSKSGDARFVRFDSDPSGGAWFSHPRVMVEHCTSPVISPSAYAAISCVSGR